MPLRHASALRPIGRIGRFDLLGRLAEGGMAEIFLAREVGPAAAERTLVVKRILPHVASHPHFREMFLHEARLCLQLRHPNICTIYEFGEDRQTFFLAMEWIDGVSLRDLLQRAFEQGGIPLPVALRIIADVAAALEHSHSAVDAEGNPLRIIHRDVTPENIMVGYDGRVQLVDFGVARAATQTHKTKTGVLKGKLAYMSPEQYRSATLDGRTDVFSLGICLFEVLAGVNPYERGSEYETMAAIALDERVPDITAHSPEVPASVEAVVRRALAREPEDRFGTADLMHAAIERCAAETGSLARAAEVSGFVRALFHDRYAQGVALDTAPLLVLRRDGADTPQPLDSAERAVLEHELELEEARYAEGRAKKARLVFAAGALVVLAAIAGLAWSVVHAGRATPEGDPARLDAPP